MGDSQTKEGFTIIEVGLVLAIAGLIFLMVFIALPSLQRSQRDSRRRDDISILLRKLKDYQTNNRGALPGGSSATYTYNSSNSNKLTWGGFYADYLGNKFEDPGGSAYVLHVKNCGGTGSVGSVCGTNMSENSTTFPNDYKIAIVLQAVCDGNQAVVSNNIRRVAIQYRMEGGGVYCANT
ncbi:type II secretion system protein [Candidatus Saccharibacteria bacterium]|nr:type II secretion system protein [Candidatus Saccharibacteria bacterium]